MNWRGPHQNGSSDEKNLPEKWTPGAENSLWTVDIPGQSTAVAANGRLYIMGHEGTGPDLQEGIYCLDAETGKVIWRRIYNDYLSDIIYTRYASSSPAIDPDSGNVYMLGTQGLLAAFNPDGKMLWSHSMMEEYGRLTFPNGRTASPVIDGNLVIATGITANWGSQGPAGHRFYAFNKLTGEPVWACDFGVRPRASSYSTPVLGWYQGRRVFWCSGGDGAILCANALNGDPIWRYPLSPEGINPTLLSYKDTVIAVHGSENLDSAKLGRMVSIRPGNALPAKPEPFFPIAPVVLTKESEAWRNDVCIFHGSPTIVGNRVYAVDETGHLNCIDADTGKIVWKHQEPLGVENRCASPLAADGKLYVPLLDGSFYIIKPGDTDCEILSKNKLDGTIMGSASVCAGRVHIQTMKKLYCIGAPKPGAVAAAPAPEPAPQPGALARLLVMPSELLLKPGDTANFTLVGVDSNGLTVPRPLAISTKSAKWEKFIPPTAKVRSMLNGEFEPDGTFKVDAKTEPTAGAIKVEAENVFGTTRGRILPDVPISENFDGFKLIPPDDKAFPPDHEAVPFAYPPLPWIGARFKWEVREKDGNKCLVKTIDNKLFQRAFTFIGRTDMHNYTVQADVMSDGVIRKVAGKEKIQKMSDVGLLNQRYNIVLSGTHQKILIVSNDERLRVDKDFPWTPNVWYTLKTRVDIDAASGEGTIHGKAWKRGEPEPDAWTIETKHKTAHQSGSPGIFGFSGQDVPVYVDNLTVTPNK